MEAGLCYGSILLASLGFYHKSVSLVDLNEQSHKKRNHPKKMANHDDMS